MECRLYIYKPIVVDRPTIVATTNETNEDVYIAVFDTSADYWHY